MAATVLTSELGRLRSFRPAHRARRTDGLADRWGAFSRLSLAVICRSGVYFGLITFVPLWFATHLQTSKALGDGALTAMLAAGAVGTLVGGRLGDRVGPRKVFIGSMACLSPLIAAFIVAGSPALATVLLVVIGATTIATFATTVVIGQQLLPGHLGIASGVTLGLAIGMGGVIAAGLGAVADAAGLTTVLWIVAVLPLPALALASSLPGARPALSQRAPERLTPSASPSQTAAAGGSTAP
jgi:MFS transporter, FSR family, fosmidomycin resistance protein